jgi:hypothetical protein
MAYDIDARILDVDDWWLDLRFVRVGLPDHC